MVYKIYSIINSNIFRMVFGIACGFVYTITLDKKYDYYDIVPDLEKKFRSRFKLDKKRLTAISVHQTSEIVDAKFIENFREKENKLREELWKIDDKSKNKKKEDEITQLHQFTTNELPIKLTPTELTIIDGIPKYLDDKLVSAKWSYVEKLY